MTMTKQHFIALAQALRDTRPAAPSEDNTPLAQGARRTWTHTVQRIADVCAISNVAFKRGAFWDACGYTAAYGRT